MTVDALALLLCSMKVMFSHPQTWNIEQCREKAVQIKAAAEKYGIEEKFIVADFAQECDLVDNVARPIYKTVILRNKPKRVIIGYDYCPMGIRVYDPELNRVKWTDSRLFETSAQKMDHWRRWCARNHTGHHWISHYNEGNPHYAESVLAIRGSLDGKEPKVKLVERTAEIVKRMNCMYRRLHGKKEPPGSICPRRMIEKIVPLKG